MAEATNPITTELDYFRRHRQDWEGKYVLIKGEKTVGFFPSYYEALGQGYKEFGLEPFLVKQISVAERNFFISRNIELCRISP